MLLLLLDVCGKNELILTSGVLEAKKVLSLEEVLRFLDFPLDDLQEINSSLMGMFDLAKDPVKSAS